MTPYPGLSDTIVLHNAIGTKSLDWKQVFRFGRVIRLVIDCLVDRLIDHWLMLVWLFLPLFLFSPSPSSLYPASLTCLPPPPPSSLSLSLSLSLSPGYVSGFDGSFLFPNIGIGTSVSHTSYSC